MSIDLPKGVRQTDISQSEDELHVYLHRVQSPPYYFMDDREMAELRIRRMSDASLAGQRFWANKSGLIGMWTSPATSEEKHFNEQFLEQMLAFHPTTTRVSGAYNLVYFRRDVSLQSNGVLRAELLWNPTQYPQSVRPAEDEAAFIRILDSMKSLE